MGATILSAQQKPAGGGTFDDPYFKKWVREQLMNHQAHLRGEEGGAPANFSNRDLSGWNFNTEKGLPLSGFKGVGACFAGAQLVNADLSNAQCALADFENADLRNANLTGADLRGARMDGARLDGARMDGVNLGPATLKAKKTTVSRAFVEGDNAASMREAQMTGVTLRNASLQGCDLSGSVLRGADMTGADLSHAVLENVDFDDAEGAREAVAGQAAMIDGVFDLDRALAANAAFHASGGAQGLCLTARNQTIQGKDLKGLVLHQARFLDCQLIDVDFSASRMDQIDFSGSTLINVQLIGVESAAPVFRRAILKRVYFAKAVFDTQALDTGDKVKPNFERAEFHNCEFGENRERCTLREPEFRNVKADAHSIQGLAAIGVPKQILRTFTVLG